MLIHAKKQEEQDRRLKAVLESLSNTPSDLTEETRFIGISLIERSSVSGRVLNLCLEPININSVLVEFKVSLLEVRAFTQIS